MVDGLDEQLHATCGGIIPHLLPAYFMAGRLHLVPGRILELQLILFIYG